MSTNQGHKILSCLKQGGIITNFCLKRGRGLKVDKLEEDLRGLQLCQVFENLLA